MVSFAIIRQFSHRIFAMRVLSLSNSWIFELFFSVNVQSSINLFRLCFFFVLMSIIRIWTCGISLIENRLLSCFNLYWSLMLRLSIFRPFFRTETWTKPSKIFIRILPDILFFCGCNCRLRNSFFSNAHIPRFDVNELLISDIIGSRRVTVPLTFVNNNSVWCLIVV